MNPPLVFSSTQNFHFLLFHWLCSCFSFFHMFFPPSHLFPDSLFPISLRLWDLRPFFYEYMMYMIYLSSCLLHWISSSVPALLASTFSFSSLLSVVLHQNSDTQCFQKTKRERREKHGGSKLSLLRAKTELWVCIILHIRTCDVVCVCVFV